MTPWLGIVACLLLAGAYVGLFWLAFRIDRRNKRRRNRP